MWTEEHRKRAISRAKQVKRYPSDLTDAEWVVIEPLMPVRARRGRRRVVDLREVVNAIRYLVRSGCEWRMPDPIISGTGGLSEFLVATKSSSVILRKRLLLVRVEIPNDTPPLRNVYIREPLALFEIPPRLIGL
jgi:hypothetical protein